MPTTDQLTSVYSTAVTWLVPFGLTVLGAIALWLIGRRLMSDTYFDANRVIREVFGEAGFPAPEQLVAVRQSA